MTRPDDIPQDVWSVAVATEEAAHVAYGDSLNDPYQSMDDASDAGIEVIARALMERDAVWAAAASYGDGSPMYTPERLRESIAGMMASRDTAIMAEREACAVAACPPNKVFGHSGGMAALDGYISGRVDAAAAIRKRGDIPTLSPSR